MTNPYVQTRDAVQYLKKRIGRELATADELDKRALLIEVLGTFAVSDRWARKYIDEIEVLTRETRLEDALRRNQE